MATQNYGLPVGGPSASTYTGAEKFSNPFYDIASDYVPRNIYDTFRWAEYLYVTMGTYKSAARKVVRYFLTDIDFTGASEQEQKNYKDFMYNDLHVMTQLAEIGDEFSVYGNVFVSIIFPFDRMLECPMCGTSYHCSTINYKFDPKNLVFSGKCRKCGKKVAFTRNDVPSLQKDRVRLRRWNVKDIRLRVHDISGRIEYFLQLPGKFVSKIEEGNPFYVNETPWSMLQAISKAGGGNVLYKFDEGAVYHLKEVTLSGFEIQGWGIPPVISNFKLAYYIQLMRKYDEAISFDFITPFRVIYPQSQTGPNMDPLQTMNMGEFVARMEEMIARKRRDPTSMQIAPFPIGYQMLGGEGKQLAPKDNVQLATDELLNAVGFPAELYKGTLSVQAAPLALRLFERTFGSLVDGYNDMISWMLGKIASYFNWDEVQGTLRSVTLADDLERKGVVLQAAAGSDISKQTAYRSMGIDYIDEQKKVVEEQTKVQELQQKAMEDQQASQAPGAGGDPAAGGDPMMAGGPGGQPGATPGDVRDQAAQIANQMLTQMTETQRRSELIKIKHSNPTLHALVKQFMQEQRQMAASQGQQMVLQQGGAM
jgi:hypothetical protein